MPLGLPVDRWSQKFRAIPGACSGRAQPDRAKDDCCWFKSIRRPIQKTAAATPSSVIIPIKQATEDGWEHQTVQLEPLNKDYQPIEISSEEADDIRVVGEFICVIEPVEE